jgi:hypothetical protein
MITPQKKKTLRSFDDPPEAAPETEVVEAVTEVAEEVPAAEPEGETATISATILGDQAVNPGDTITLEVVEASTDDGTVTVKYKKPAAKGIAAGAREFDQMPAKEMI